MFHIILTKIKGNSFVEISTQNIHRIQQNKVIEICCTNDVDKNAIFKIYV